MRKTLAVLTVAAMLLSAAKCGKEEPPKKPIIKTEAVAMCFDKVSRIRQEDARCEEGTDFFLWTYVTAAEFFPAELPGVGSKLQEGKGSLTEPKNLSISRVPREGGAFVTP